MFKFQFIGMPRRPVAADTSSLEGRHLSDSFCLSRFVSVVVKFQFIELLR